MPVSIGLITSIRSLDSPIIKNLPSAPTVDALEDLPQDIILQARRLGQLTLTTTGCLQKSTTHSSGRYAP